MMAIILSALLYLVLHIAVRCVDGVFSLLFSDCVDGLCWLFVDVAIFSSICL